MTSKQLPIPVERIEKAILLVRDQKVMLNADLVEQIVAIFEAIRQLMTPPEPPRKRIYPVKFKLAA